METFGKRVVAARLHAGFKSGSKFARKIGITQSGLHQLEKGQAISSKHSYRIAQLTGVNIEWLETGKGQMVSEKSESDAALSPDQSKITSEITIPEINIPAMLRDVPILGATACGEDGLFEISTQILDQARRPPRLTGVKDVYAFYVTDELMSPWREPGQLVYVHPHQPANIGDYVVVYLSPDKSDTASRAYVRRLVRRSDDKIVLLQHYPRKETTISMKRVKTIHRIIDWSELMGV